MNKEDYEKYYQKGGSYVIPIEAFNDLVEEMECFRKECKQLKNELKSYQEMYFDKVMIINNAIDKLYCWGEALNPEFQKIMLDILKEVE